MDGQTSVVQEDTQASQPPASGAQEQQAGESAQEKVSTLQKFINGLFGAKDSGADGQKAESGDVPAEKNFSQADLDAAITAARKQWDDEAAEAERVKKLPPEQREAEEQLKKDARIADLEGQLLKKELREAAVKALEKDGYPAGLAETLDYSSKDRMEESLKNTVQIFKDSLASAVTARLKGKTPEGLGGAATGENLLRDQIARNIRGI